MTVNPVEHCLLTPMVLVCAQWPPKVHVTCGLWLWKLSQSFEDCLCINAAFHCSSGVLEKVKECCGFCSGHCLGALDAASEGGHFLQGVLV